MSFMSAIKSGTARKSFWGTSMATGTGQILGMGLLGGAVGGTSAWASGGNFSSGFVNGALLGAVGGAYNASIRSGAGEGLMLAGRRAGGLRAGDMGPMTPRGQKIYDAGASLAGTSNKSRAWQMSAGAGLAGGLMFSGHKRRPVNGYNSRRGNYIGG
jgi:hypothetical protein